MTYQEDIEEMKEQIANFVGGDITTTNQIKLVRVEYDDSTSGYHGRGYDLNNTEYCLRWLVSDWQDTLVADTP